jgi:hypothetical protein
VKLTAAFLGMRRAARPTATILGMRRAARPTATILGMRRAAPPTAAILGMRRAAWPANTILGLRFAAPSFVMFARNVFEKEIACPSYLQHATFWLGDALSHLGEAIIVAGPQVGPRIGLPTAARAWGLTR